MKKFALLLTVSCLATMASFPLKGQSFSLIAQIPFPFIMGDKTMPAGEYTVTTRGIVPGVVMVQNSSSNESVLTLEQPMEGKTADALTPKLIFELYGSHYFLSEVWPGFGDAGLEINPAGELHKAVKERAASLPDSVVVVALR
jgi:hypothetical protein